MLVVLVQVGLELPQQLQQPPRLEQSSKQEGGLSCSEEEALLPRHLRQLSAHHLGALVRPRGQQQPQQHPHQPLARHLGALVRPQGQQEPQLQHLEVAKDKEGQVEPSCSAQRVSRVGSPLQQLGLRLVLAP